MTTDELAYKALEGLGAAPLWRFYGNLFPAQPKSRAVPHRWNWHELRPHLLHFSQTLSLEEAERRVLMLVNPGLTDPRPRSTPSTRASRSSCPARPHRPTGTPPTPSASSSKATVPGPPSTASGSS